MTTPILWAYFDVAVSWAAAGGGRDRRRSTVGRLPMEPITSFIDVQEQADQTRNSDIDCCKNAAMLQFFIFFNDNGETQVFSWNWSICGVHLRLEEMCFGSF